MDWLRRRKYAVLLVSLLALVALFPVLRATATTRLVLDVLSSLVLLAALLMVFTNRWTRLVAVLLGVPALVGLWTGYFVPRLPRYPLLIGFHLLSALFLAFTIGVILRDVFREKGVSVDSVYGAFCGYILTGLTFGHLYGLVALCEPGSFQGEGIRHLDPEEHLFLLTYFSFLTLTTVGYGDIVPAHDLARGLVCVQAVAGQFYLAVLVAELIGKRVGQALAPPEPTPGPPGGSGGSEVSGRP